MKPCSSMTLVIESINILCIAYILFFTLPSLLQLSNYSSYEGVLYCKPHFDQLFKMTGSLDKSFEGNYCRIESIATSLQQFFFLSFLFLFRVTYISLFTGAPKTARVDRSTNLGAASSKISSMFAGTQDKCVACSKTVYPLEKVLVTSKLSSLFPIYFLSECVFVKFFNSTPAIKISEFLTPVPKHDCLFDCFSKKYLH